MDPLRIATHEMNPECQLHRRAPKKGYIIQINDATYDEAEDYDDARLLAARHLFMYKANRGYRTMHVYLNEPGRKHQVFNAKLVRKGKGWEEDCAVEVDGWRYLPGEYYVCKYTPR